MNKKGFTLIELIVTIVVLSIVMSIGAFSIINIVKNSKEKNYVFLINNIKDGAEVYYQECKYSNNSGINCDNNDGVYTTTLGDLVRYGYVKGNSKDKNNNYALVNTLNDNDITECVILVKYNAGKVLIESSSSNSDCPSNNDYVTGKMDDGRQ